MPRQHQTAKHEMQAGMSDCVRKGCYEGFEPLAKTRGPKSCGGPRLRAPKHHVAPRLVGCPPACCPLATLAEEVTLNGPANESAMSIASGRVAKETAEFAETLCLQSVWPLAELLTRDHPWQKPLLNYHQ